MGWLGVQPGCVWEAPVPSAPCVQLELRTEDRLCLWSATADKVTRLPGPELCIPRGKQESRWEALGTRGPRINRILKMCT